MTPLSSTSDFPFSDPQRLLRRRAVGVLAILLATLAGLALPTTADALCDPCEIYLMPNTRSIRVPLPGMLLEAGDTATSISDEKSATDLLYGTGSYDGRSNIYTYTPDDNFWTVGSDQASFFVRSANGVDGIRSFIFLAGDRHLAKSVSFDFENATDLSEWDVFPAGDENTFGNPMTVNLVDRAAGPNFLLTTSSPAMDRGVKEENNNNPDLARTQSIGGHANGSETDLPNRVDPLEVLERVLTVSDADLDDVVFIERLSMVDGAGNESFYARGAINPFYFDCTNRAQGTEPGNEDLDAPATPCETRWMLLADPENQIIRFEIAQRIFGVEVPQPWSLQSSIETVTVDGNGEEQYIVEFAEEEWTALHDVNALPNVLLSRVGAIGVETTDASETVTNRMKSAHTFISTFAGYPNTFTEDFNAQNQGTLSSSGLTSFVHEGIAAQYFDGIQSAVQNQEDDMSLFHDLTKIIPYAYPAGYTVTGEAGDRTSITYEELIQEDEVRLKMTIHSHPRGDSGLVTDYYPAWTSFDFLQIGKLDDTPDAGPIQVRFSTDASGNRRFRLRTFGSNGGLLNNEWLSVGDDKEISFTLHWKRNTSTNGTADGFVHMIVNGQKVSVTGIENSGQTGEYITLGAWNLSLVKMPPADILPFGFDDIVIAGDADLQSLANPNL